MGTVTTWEKAGFFNGKINIELALQRLADHINNVPEILQDFSVEELAHRPSPGKWSKKEILGHLIDSAINNLKRFTDIQFLPQPYKVISYRQNELVAINHYQDLPLAHLLDFWKTINQQIIYVVQNIPADKLDYPVDPQYDNGEMRSLGWIVCYYVAQLEDHLRQITENQS